MSTFIVGFKNGSRTFVDELDIFHAISKLNQDGHRYDIAFIIEKGQESQVTKLFIDAIHSGEMLKQKERE
jgi:hypothetical protein